MTDNISTESSSCCSSAASPAVADNGRENLLAAAGSPTAEATAICPVMGGVADKARAEASGAYRDYEGKRYWFCCPGCGPTFDADPVRYAIAA